MAKVTILSLARFTAHEERREEFEGIIAELTARAENEPGTLRYRFFRGEPGQYSAVEEYADADAVVAHQEANQDLLARAFDCSAEISINVHGPVGPVIREWAQNLDTITIFEEPIPPIV